VALIVEVNKHMSGVGKNLIGYGLAIIALGAMGYFSNPEKAISALIAGGTVGGLSLILGVLVNQGKTMLISVAMGVVGLAGLAFGWRAFGAWKAVLGGNNNKMIAACLISTMFILSIAMFSKLIKGFQRGSAQLAG
jgi:uncharacterized membrane protein (UPF0136 family)